MFQDLMLLYLCTDHQIKIVFKHSVTEQDIYSLTYQVETKDLSQEDRNDEN